MHLFSSFVVVALSASLAAAQCSDIPDNPMNDTLGAGFGLACAMNAAGDIALVSGPGYDSGDGLVRTFERVGGNWVEGLTLPAMFQFGENFGQCIAMNDAGTRAVITAPREPITSPGFFPAAGSVYIFERDDMTGEWLQTQQWYAPTPGTEHNFGASCDISADGNTVVIGQTNILGSEFANLPDAVYVATFDGSSWSALTQLTTTPAVPDHLNLGTTVKISDDGTLIAAGAPNAQAFTSESGRVVVFENQMGTWTHTDTLTRTTGDSFNIFGRTIGLDGDTLIVCNPFETTEGPNFEPGPPICIYERSGSTYPSSPDELMFQSLNAPTPNDFVVRGNTLLVCDDASSGFPAGLFRYVRDFEDPTKTWRFDSVFKSNDSPGFENTGYGTAAAMSDDPEIFVIGEPFWTMPGGFGEGRINFPDRVFTAGNFQIAEGTSFMSVDFDFPGLPLQTLFVQLLGFFDLSYPLNCDGSEVPIQAVIEDFQLTTMQDEFVLDGPLGMDITLSDVQISLASPSDPSPIDEFQQGTFTGMTVQVDAMVQIGILPAFPFSTQGDQTGPMPAQITGGAFGTPLGFSIPNLELDFEPDLGLGSNNPTIAATGNIASQINETECPPDLTGEGDLNFLDISEFLMLYANQDPAVDFEPDGNYNFLDVSAFLAVFAAGCP